MAKSDSGKSSGKKVVAAKPGEFPGKIG